MINQLFLTLSLLGSQWVLFLLIFLSIFSIAIILERFWHYQTSSRGLEAFRDRIREAAHLKKWDEIKKITEERRQKNIQDLETSLVAVLAQSSQIKDPSQLSLLSQDALLRSKISWDKNLSFLATIGSNAPFIGLFGTVLGIIKAFHDLSQQAVTGAQTISSGIAEALVATAVGLLVAIPAVIAYNFFGKRVKTALIQAEALKSFLIAKILE